MRAFQSDRDFAKTYKKLRKFPEVVGIDQNLHYTIKKDGKREYYVVIYLNEMTNRIKQLSLKINGYPIRYIIMGDPCSRGLGIIPASGANVRRERPLISGISACHYTCSACTLSGFFQEEKTLKTLVASNEHCFGLEGKAKVGDPLVQPSPLDGGLVPRDVIGTFYKHVYIEFENYACPYRQFAVKIGRFLTRKGLVMNKVDISFGLLEVDFKSEARDIGIINGKRLPNLGEFVQKSGRTTGHTTHGRVISTSWTGVIEYARGKATFTDCILIEGNYFSAPGDSGSPVFDMKGNLIGVLFAGSKTHTIVCKISNIEEIGKVTLILGHNIYRSLQI